MKNPLSVIASLFMSIFFVAIMLFVMLAVLHVENYATAISVFTFSIINFVIFIGVIGFGKSLSKAIGVGSYAPICLVTIVYTLVQFIHLGIFFKSDTAVWYTLFHIILLFVYCAIVIPIAITGLNDKNNK